MFEIVCSNTASWVALCSTFRGTLREKPALGLVHLGRLGQAGFGVGEKRVAGPLLAAKLGYWIMLCLPRRRGWIAAYFYCALFRFNYRQPRFGNFGCGFLGHAWAALACFESCAAAGTQVPKAGPGAPSIFFRSDLGHPLVSDFRERL